MSDLYEKLREDAQEILARPGYQLYGNDPEHTAAVAAEVLANLGPLLDNLQRMHPFHAVCGCTPCQLWAAWTTARAKLVTT